MFVKTALKILASAALILPQSTVLGDKHVAPADTAPANVGTMTQNDGSDPDAKPWTGTACEFEVCLSASVYQGNFYVYMFNHVPLSSLQFAITYAGAPVTVTPVAAMASEAVISNSLVYVEEPEELVITKVPEGMPPIPAMDASLAPVLFGVYESVSGSNNTACKDDYLQVDLDIMVNCEEARSFELVKMLATTTIEGGKVQVSKHPSSGGRDVTVCCCFVNEGYETWGPATVMYSECMEVANGDNNALANGFTTPLYETCSVFNIGSCEDNPLYVESCCPTSGIGK